MSKFHNIKKTIDGITFQSRREADRYQDLKLMLKAGMIDKLELQPKYSLDVNGIHIANYFADFAYLDLQRNYVVEDAKGIKTPAYKLKKKLMLACHGIEIQEV